MPGIDPGIKKLNFLAYVSPGIPLGSLKKKFTPFGPAVWPALGNIYQIYKINYYIDNLMQLITNHRYLKSLNQDIGRFCWLALFYYRFIYTLLPVCLEYCSDPRSVDFKPCSFINLGLVLSFLSVFGLSVLGSPGLGLSVLVLLIPGFSILLCSVFCSVSV